MTPTPTLGAIPAHGRSLLPYRLHRAGYTDAVAVAQEAVGTTGNPVTGIDVSGTTLTVIFADGSSESHALPAGGGGADQIARDLAATAQTTADSAQTDAQAAGSTASSAAGAAATAQAAADTNRTNLTDHEADANAHHVPPTGGGGGDMVVNVPDGRLPFDPVEMRIGWLQTPTTPVNAATFAPPATVGTTAQTLVPDFPQAFLDLSLRRANLAIWAATDLELAGVTGDYISTAMGTALDVDGVSGSYWITDALIGLYDGGNPVTLIFPGPVIATQDWVNARPGGGGAPVLIGSATVPVGQSPFTLRLANTEADTFFTAYNAGTYPGGYRIDLTWAVSNAQHALAAVLPPELWATMTDGISYTLHLDAGAALDSTTSRYVQFSRTALQDFVEIASLPVSDDFDAGTTFRVYGLP